MSHYIHCITCHDEVARTRAQKVDLDVRGMPRYRCDWCVAKIRAWAMDAIEHCRPDVKPEASG